MQSIISRAEMNKGATISMRPLFGLTQLFMREEG